MCQQYKIEASMTKYNILFIGLDTHKSFPEVAYITLITQPWVARFLSTFIAIHAISLFGN